MSPTKTKKNTTKAKPKAAPKETMPKFGLTFGLFIVSIFMSAFLLFMVQPMSGKMLMPLVGGAPSGWIVALAFFQTSLLVGYLVAHGLSKVSARVHGLAVAGLLALGAVFLPLGFDINFVLEDSSQIASQVFILLTTSIFVPFVALSAVSSTVQRLFANTKDTKGRDPYFLYAISNFGSFLGLLGYPLFFEPLFAVSDQTQYWAYIYGFLVMFIFLSSLKASNEMPKKSKKKIKPLERKDCVKWVALSFVSSGLLVAITNFLTLEVAGVPMLWALPLSIYLATFIYAFAKDRPSQLDLFRHLHPIAVTVIILMYAFMSSMPNIYLLSLHVIGFTLIAMFAHFELSATRPKPEHLTAFYLYIALGGALGGLVNAFIVPFLFARTFEYPIIVLMSLLLSPMLFSQKATDRGKIFTKKSLDLTLIFLVIVVALALVKVEYLKAYRFFFFLAGFGLTAFLLNRLKYALFFSFAVLFTFAMITQFENIVYKGRNFFGSIFVIEEPVMYADTKHTVRYLRHGSTIHGLEVLSDEKTNVAETSYYGTLADTFNQDDYPINDVAVIGLGAGTLLCYDAPDRRFAAFEIDEEIIAVAKKYFSYIDECAHPENELILGDGRLEYERFDREYDVLVIDAFSSDAIPTHLLTQEAFEIYKKRLKEDGLITINISNRYFDLGPVVAKTSETVGFNALIKFVRIPEDGRPWQMSNLWMTLTQSDERAQWYIDRGWHDIKPQDNVSLWTDDYTHLLSSLIIGGINYAEDAPTDDDQAQDKTK